MSKALGLGLVCPEDCGRDNPLTGQRDVRPCNNRKEAEERVAGSRVAGGATHTLEPEQVAERGEVLVAHARNCVKMGLSAALER